MAFNCVWRLDEVILIARSTDNFGEFDFFGARRPTFHKKFKLSDLGVQIPSAHECCSDSETLLSPETETLRGKYVFIAILKNGIAWSVPDDYELSDGIAQDKHAENNGEKAAPASLKLNLAIWQFELKEVPTDIGH